MSSAAVARDPYAGLLVSLHVLALSAFATGPSPLAGSLWNLGDARIRFEVNRFQHAMIELQESLRQQLRLRIDQPLKHGLAENSDDPAERRLTHDFRLLQAMDILSLCLCCTKAPFTSIDSLKINIARPSHDLIELNPWPFADGPIRIEIPFRRLPAKPFSDETEFRAAYTAAAIERFTVTLQNHTI